jgi:hypothetical protein
MGAEQQHIERLPPHALHECTDRSADTDPIIGSENLHSYFQNQVEFSYTQVPQH